MSTATIKDAGGRGYVVPDIRVFAQHLRDFHYAPDTVHTEGGRRFQVDDELRALVEQMAARQP